MKRNLVAGVLALLVIIQMLAVPLAWAAASHLECLGCDDSGTASTSHPDHDCSDHHPAPDGASDGSRQHHPGTAGHCNCGHASAHGQAVAMPVTVVLLPVQPEALSGEPKGPAFSAPLFEFLRPPK